MLLLAYLPACANWQVGGPTPAEYVAAKSPPRVRVTLADSSIVILKSPIIRGDSLIGFVGSGLAKDDPMRTVSFPLSDVRAVEVNKGTSAGVIIAAVAAVAVVVALATYEEPKICLSPPCN
jgi:hypothetical protein